MSIGSTSLYTLRSDLRFRLNEISEKQFDDSELNRWLNLGQYEVYNRIRDWNEVWYLASKTITINSADNGNDYIDLSGSNYFSTDWAKVDEIHTVVANTYYQFSDVVSTNSRYPVKIIPLSMLFIKRNSEAFDYTPYCSRSGSSMYFSKALATNDAFWMFYYRKPVDMTSSLNLDVPDWTQDLVIMFAYKLCLLKNNKDTSDVDKQINSRLEYIRNVFASDNKIDETIDKESEYSE